ncbi:MAG: DNA primase [Bacteroidota bacterium]|nr:DNA primase [Bacteroidota bacterium]
MGLIDQHTVQKIYDSIDIVDIISDYVSLKRAGSNYKGLCPFHSEKTPSFMVSPAKGIYKCFGCGASGQAVKFIMEQDGLSYPEALRHLAKRYNIEIQEEEVSEEALQARKEKESLQVITEFGEKFFVTNLLHTTEGKNIALSYFKERGISDASIQKYKLGWSPEKRDAFTQHAEKSGYKTELLKQSGLSIIKENYKFDRFAGRVIFPIHSVSGKVVGFGGRILRNDKKTAKYLNSPESEIYNKSKVLYGIYQAKNAILKKKKCYVAEGYTDVISIAQIGIENIVSSSGTALTSDQIKLIRRFTENITLVFDGDPAGLNAALRGVDLVLQEEMNVKIVVLPQGEDPDTFARENGKEETERFFEENEQDFISFKTSLLKEDAKDDPVKRAQNITSIVQSISVIPNSILRSEYIKTCSSILKIKEQVLHEELTKKLHKKKEDRRKKNQRETRKKKTPVISESVSGVYSETNEKEIIRYLLIHGNDMLAFREDEKDLEKASEFIVREMKNSNLDFRNLAFKSIFSAFDNFSTEGQVAPEDFFLRHDDEKIRNLAAEILGPQRELSILWEKQGGKQILSKKDLAFFIIQAIEKYKLKIVQLQIEQVDKTILHLDPAEFDTRLDDLLRKKQDLDKLKKELTNFTDKSALL